MCTNSGEAVIFDGSYILYIQYIILNKPKISTAKIGVGKKIFESDTVLYSYTHFLYLLSIRICHEFISEEHY